MTQLSPKGTVKSPKVKYLKAYLFQKKKSARFEDCICTSNLEGFFFFFFFFEKLFFQGLGAFMTTGKPLIWVSFFAQKINLYIFEW